MISGVIILLSWSSLMKKCLGKIVSIYFKLFLLDSTKDDVKDVKMKCLSDPERFLWTP
jgi:hypothetical protein